MTEVDFWRGEFGDHYTSRNQLDSLMECRRRFIGGMVPDNCSSLLEVGANVGFNLEALSMDREIELYANEPNDLARDRLLEWMPATHVAADPAHELKWPDGITDCVMTCGVLIHIGPELLLPSMKQIYRCARRYIMIGEYYARNEEMIEYRGHKNKLWRRDYGGLFCDTFPDLRCVHYVLALKRFTGLDDILFWLLQKGNRPN